MKTLKLAKQLSRAAWQATRSRLRDGDAGPSKTWRRELVLALMRRDFERATEFSPASIRRRQSATPLLGSLKRRVTLSERQLGGRPCLSITPQDRLDGNATLLYLHGGGYCVCSPATHRALAAQLAIDSGLRVELPDYRLAPEDPYPAAVNDALAALRELIDEVGTAQDVFLGGDSAGGGLSLATAIAQRDASGPQPGAMILLSPWVDMALEGESIDSNAVTDYLSRRVLSAFATHYLGGLAVTDPGPSPLRADLRGLPPTMIQLGGVETLRSEGELLAKRLEEAGVTTELQVIEGACHVFQAFAPLHPDAKPAIRGLGRFLRRRARTR